MNQSIENLHRRIDRLAAATAADFFRPYDNMFEQFCGDDESPSAPPFDVVVAAADFSPCSYNAMQRAFALQQRLGSSTIILAHVLSPVAVADELSRQYPIAVRESGQYLTPSDTQLIDVIANVREQHYTRLNTFLARLQPPGDAKLCVLVGDPAAKIVELARQVKADLLMLGTHGRSGLERVVLGSVAESVIRQASCPVVTIHD